MKTKAYCYKLCCGGDVAVWELNLLTGTVKVLYNPYTSGDLMLVLEQPGMTFRSKSNPEQFLSDVSEETLHRVLSTDNDYKDRPIGHLRNCILTALECLNKNGETYGSGLYD